MEYRPMRHFTKEEQKKYTESILKLYKPTGGSIMADQQPIEMGAKELRGANERGEEELHPL